MEALGIDPKNNSEIINQQLTTRTEDEIETAIMNTWTGKIAHKLGFKIVTQKNINAEKVTVIFKDVGDTNIKIVQKWE